MRAREPMVGRWRPVSRSGRRSWPGLWARTPCAGPDPGAFGAVDHAATPSVVRLRWLIRPSQPVRQFTVRRNARPRSASRRALLGLPLRGITMLPMPSSGRSSSTAACRSRVRGHRARFPAGAFDQPFHRWFEPGRVGRVARLHVMVEQSSKICMTTPVNFAVLAAHAKDGDRPVDVRVEHRSAEPIDVTEEEIEPLAGSREGSVAAVRRLRARASVRAKATGRLVSDHAAPAPISSEELMAIKKAGGLHKSLRDRLTGSEEAAETLKSGPVPRPVPEYRRWRRHRSPLRPALGGGALIVHVSPRPRRPDRSRVSQLLRDALRYRQALPRAH